jgi:3-isopropylmalate/(R)-2-methylmalate dehydratase small subunit
MQIKGRVWKFGDDINTDEIIAAKYLVTTNENELGKHCMETINRNFPSKISKGDILVAGKNFGCGSSREHAPLAIKGCGISCVVAESFAGIFLRNSINIGLPLIECKEAKKINEVDEVIVDFSEGKIKNITQNREYQIIKFPLFLQDIIKSGGLIAWAKKTKQIIK